MKQPARTAGFGILTLILLIHCGQSTSPGRTDYNLTIQDGNNQSGYQNTLLPHPVVVRVTDEKARPLSDVELEATVTAGGGHIENDSLVTDEQGWVEIAWRLGEKVTNKLSISIKDEEDPITCSATAQYLYMEPELLDDGWDVASLDTSKAEVRHMLTAVDHIRMGINTEIHSLLVIAKNRLVLETYFPGHNSNGDLIQFTRETPHEVQSASKSFRSALIGIAIDKGFIQDENEKLYDFFPEYSYLVDEQKDKITLDHVLTMSSGLDWDEWQYPYGDSRNTLSSMYANPASQWAYYVLSRPNAYEPGTTFVYNTGASIMLNSIIMHAINMSFSNFVYQYYAELTGSVRLPGVGYPLGGETTPRDMAKLGAIYLNDGKWHNTQIVSQSWVDKSIVQKFRFSSSEGYGYQWWMKKYTTGKATYDSFYASGNGGQYIIVIKQLDLVIVFTGGNFNSSEGMNQPFDIVRDYILPAFE